MYKKFWKIFLPNTCPCLFLETFQSRSVVKSFTLNWGLSFETRKRRLKACICMYVRTVQTPDASSFALRFNGSQTRQALHTLPTLSLSLPNISYVKMKLISPSHSQNITRFGFGIRQLTRKKKTLLDELSPVLYKLSGNNVVLSSEVFSRSALVCQKAWESFLLFLG